MKKYNLKNNQSANRSQSLSMMSPYSTIAQFNKVSNKIAKPIYNSKRPMRITLPQFFNIPTFKDADLPFKGNITNNIKNTKIFDGSLKRRMKDLNVLAQGMKRAKNIKQQSRCYYIQGYQKALQYFDKFLKIVLFIKDEKSIQLVLNCIGSSYMYMNQPLKAIQYHQKQISIINNADVFVGQINTGLCYQLNQEYQNAYRQYQSAQKLLLQTDEIGKKLQLVNNLLKRVEDKILQNEENDAFMTENIIHKQKAGRKIQGFQQNSKDLYLKKMETSPTRRQYQNAKIGYAVCKAQQKIKSFINFMRNSYGQQKSNS